MSNTPKLVGFLTNAYAPYKEPLLVELAAKLNLKVYYCALTEPNRRWEVKLSERYSYVVLRGLMFNIGSVTFHFNPGIVWRLLIDRPSVLIVGGYSFPTVWIAPVICRLLGIPTILWSGSTQLEASRRRKITDPLKRLFLRFFDGYVAYSSRASHYLQDLGVPANAITVAPVTVDVQFFSTYYETYSSGLMRHNARNELGIEEESFVIVFVGQFIHRKGGDILLRAFAKLGDLHCQLLMVGDGPLKEEWRELSDTLSVGSKVRWFGNVGQEQVARLYAISDVMVLPSRTEIAGRVVNEAMAAGLPVIITDHVGNDVLRDAVDGFVVPVGDVDALADRLEILVEEPEMRVAMGHHARERLAQEYTIEREAGKFVEAVNWVAAHF